MRILNEDPDSISNMSFATVCCCSTLNTWRAIQSIVDGGPVKNSQLHIDEELLVWKQGE